MTDTAFIIAYAAKILTGIKALAGIKPLIARFARGEPLRRYRPERHYMRGPGPQWHAKHDPLH
jgi:hypothetical protein